MSCIHLGVDCGACDIDKIKDSENIKNFFNEIVNILNASAIQELSSVQYGTEYTRQGCNVSQLLETGNIHAYFCYDTGDLYLNIFSRETFETSKIMQSAINYFSPHSKVISVLADRDVHEEITNRVFQQQKWL